MARRIQRTAGAVSVAHLAALAALWAWSAGRPTTPPRVIQVQITTGAPASPRPATPPALAEPISPAASTPNSQSISPALLPPQSLPERVQVAAAQENTTRDTQPLAKSSGAVSSDPQARPTMAAGDREPAIDASFRGNPLPVYPALSRRLGEQGTVMLRVLITAEGRATEVRIEKSSGSARLDQAAVAAIREWRFIPAARGGQAISAWYEWKWQFRLDP